MIDPTKIELNYGRNGSITAQDGTCSLCGRDGRCLVVDGIERSHMIEVVNLKLIKLPAEMLEPVIVYIGRQMGKRKGSPLANPYKLEKGMTRGYCLDLYKKWLARQLQIRESAQYRELGRLAMMAQKKDVMLACWCAPMECHGDIIKAEIERLHSVWEIETKSNDLSANE